MRTDTTRLILIFHIMYLLAPLISHSQVKPLIWVEARVEKHARSRVEVLVKARSQFRERRYMLAYA